MNPQLKAKMDNDLRHIPFGTVDYEQIISSLASEAVAQSNKNKYPYAVAAVLLSNYKPFLPYAKYIGSYKGQQALYLVGPLQMLSQVRKSGGTGFVMAQDGQILPTSDASNEMYKLSEKISQSMAMPAAKSSTSVSYDGVPRRGDGSEIPTGPAPVRPQPRQADVNKRENERAEQALRNRVANNPIPKPPASPIPKAEAIDVMADFITEDIRDSNGIKYQDRNRCD